MLSESVDNTFV